MIYNYDWYGRNGYWYCPYMVGPYSPLIQNHELEQLKQDQDLQVVQDLASSFKQLNKNKKIKITIEIE